MIVRSDSSSGVRIFGIEFIIAIFHMSGVSPFWEKLFIVNVSDAAVYDATGLINCIGM